MSQKVSYDKESEVFSVEVSKDKSVDSDIRGNVVIDYGKKGEIVRVNFYNFSFDNFRKGMSAIKEFAHNNETHLLAH